MRALLTLLSAVGACAQNSCAPCNAGGPCAPCKACVNKARNATCADCTGGSCAWCWAPHPELPNKGLPCLGEARKLCCLCWDLLAPGTCKGSAPPAVPTPIPAPSPPTPAPAPVPPTPPAPAPTPPSPPAPGPGGDVTLTLKHGTLQRTAILHMPPTPAPSGGYPVVINMHGLGGQASSQKFESGDRSERCGSGGCSFSDIADTRGWIVVYPQGYQKSWNGGKCCGTAAKENVDDVGFLRDLIDNIAGAHPVNRARVFSTGFSNGAIMSWRLACEAPDLVWAVAPVHGAFNQGQPASFECNVSRPVSVLAFVGLQDRLQGPDVEGPGGNASVTDWRRRLGHTAAPTQSFANVSTTCSYTTLGAGNVTWCGTATGKCATHAYAGGIGTSQFQCPAEIHTTEQVLDFFAAQ